MVNSVETAPPAPVITGTPTDPVEVGTAIQLRCGSETKSEDATLTWFTNDEEVKESQQQVEVCFYTH